MIRRLSLAVILILVFSSTQAACVLVGPQRRSGAAVVSPNCHPSQYWDGSQCRHKGKGSGARKHDGRR